MTGRITGGCVGCVGCGRGFSTGGCFRPDASALTALPLSRPAAAVFLGVISAGGCVHFGGVICAAFGRRIGSDLVASMIGSSESAVSIFSTTKAIASVVFSNAMFPMALPIASTDHCSDSMGVEARGVVMVGPQVRLVAQRQRDDGKHCFKGVG